jgi:trimeric autotransporter adhesin
VNQHVRFIESGEFLTYPKPTGGNSSDRLIERKQMSTKTTFKRIALVTVAALGFGVLTSVAPASATGSANANITAITAGASAPARVGVASGATVITLTVPSGSYSDTVTAQVAAAPTGSVDASLAFSAAATKPAATADYTDTSTKTSQSIDDGIAKALITATAGSSSTTTNLLLTLNADVAGTYTILVTADAAATGYSAGKKSVSYSITTAGTPTSMTVTAINSTTYDADSNGALVKVALKDAAGTATVLGLNEALNLTAAAGSTLSNFGGSATALGAADFLRGFGMFRVVQDVTVDTAEVVTVSGSGLLSATFNAQVGISIVAADAAATTDVFSLGTAGTEPTYTYGTPSTTTYPVNPTKTGYGVKVSVTTPATGGLTASYATKAVVTDTSGLITGIPGAIFTKPLSIAAAGTSVSITGGVALGTTGSVSIAVTTNLTANTPTSTTYVFNGTLSSSTYTISAISPAAVTSALLGTNTFTAKVTDDYGVAVAGVAITGKISAGRNLLSTPKTMLSDASGYVSYSITDAGTTGTSDTVTFERTSDGSGDVSATITYGTLSVSTVTLTGGNTDAGVTATTPVIKPIEADNTPESATIDIAATVKDANSVLLAGVPVVFTLSSTDGAAFTTTTSTVYTLSTGVATAKLYAWKAGTYTITATAGGKTGTATATFGNSRPADARVISATADGSVVTAKVVDRFGNPVSGVTVYASKIGTGSFGGGTTRADDDTDVTGTVEFVYNGNADVVVSTVNPATPGDKGSGQTCAAAGNIDCPDVAADATAFSAYVAGTSTVDAKYVGSSFAAAGVNKASVTIANDSASAAADASAEATDAANAATDAANAAAEAADAATAAAQDAADAVAALSTQVSEMVNALKKQITALTNLVIKIQKKVKA